ncbi:MAG: DUF2752 domain-containing protein [Planctomycetes bacterium]|nr:DUF2752 domain-containing protein [Planctomycetota bacterium]
MSNKPTINNRIVASVVLVAVIGIFAVLWASGTGRVDMSRWLGICGFRQSYALPCPFCHITHAAEAFAHGQIIEAFYIQPTGGVFCVVLAGTGVLALLIAVFGVDFAFLHQKLSRRMVKYVVVSLIIVVGAGWAVTLARAMAQGR